MKRSIVKNGLKITTRCDYVKFTESDFLEVKEDVKNNLLEIKFPKGFLNTNVVDRHVTPIDESVTMKPTDFIKIKTPLITIGKVSFYKLIPDVINFSQFIVKDIDDFIVSRDGYKITILIPESKLDDINTYVKCIKSIPYFEVNEVGDSPVLSNLYNINLSDSNFNSNLSNNFVFATKKYYDRYILRMVDILESFITKLEGVLEGSGIKLMGLPNDELTETSDRLMYRITELGTQISHKSDSNELRYAVNHRTTIAFELTTSNFILYNDFKTRYQNLDFVSNFTEFYTKDSYGLNWISNIEWNRITTDFDQSYGVDNSGNFAYTASFECNIYYYVVFDETYHTIGEIVTNLLNESNNSILIIKNG